ncbi:MAG: RCC1 repeat-containing protein [Spirochaetota bacterium]|nr:MAG: RCC1 repeat-containing protein [Spirochaetota bacterium]
MDAGYYHTIALKEDGSVWIWGSNDYGQLGNGDYPNNRSKPVYVLVESGGDTLNNIVSVAAGYKHSVALKNDRTVWAWGMNNTGQLGDNTNIPGTYSDIPVQVVGSGGGGSLTGIVAVAAGMEHTVALMDDGTVWTWGRNSEGQLGDGNMFTPSATPVQVLGYNGEGTLSGVVGIDAGDYHSLAVKEDGTVWAWGHNYWGQLGDGNSPENSKTPVQVVGYEGGGILTGIVAVSAADEHTVALKNGGTVWAWGRNNTGQLGDNTNIPGTDSDTPVQVTGEDGEGVLTDVIAIGAGGGQSASYTVAIEQDGTAWAWGVNSYGQLGNGNNPTGSDTPFKVAGYEGQGNLSGIVALGTGLWHTVSLMEDGTIWTWGRNDSGELGDGSTTTRYTPITITSAVGISAGTRHTAALLDDGTLRTWGYNEYGQLGDGTTNDSLIPVTVTTDGINPLTNIADVSCGGINYFSLISHYTVALMEDGTLRAWGQNTYGQLGDGTTDDRHLPVTVTTDGINPLINVASISSEISHTMAVLNDGTVKAWGRNFNGQLGNDTKDDSPLPVTVIWDHDDDPITAPIPLTNVDKIVTGSGHSVALLSNGTVRAWGNNDMGQLCNGTTDESLMPITVVWDHDDDPITDPIPLTNVASIAAGFLHTVFLLTDGTIKTSSWEDPYLPVTGTIDGTTPLTGVVAIDSGSGHVVALMDDNTVMAGGDNSYGQIGDGTTDTRDFPVTVLKDGTSPLTDVVAVSAGAGGSYTLFLRYDGIVQACGANSDGQLGDSTTTDKYLPVTTHIYNAGWNR